MHIRQTLENLNNQPLALTIGNFDGVHLGHQAILKTLVQTAEQQSFHPSAMTFSPHARALFGDCRNYLISSDEEKAAQMQTFGIQTLYQIPFDKAFSSIRAEDFIDILIQQLQVKYLLVGDDFRFGYQGKGNFELLARVCQAHHVTVQHTPTIRYGKHRISSSRVRQAIVSADFDLVATLMGRKLRYHGEVIAGNRLGRTIGYPTANIRLPETRLLPNGVFAVNIEISKSKQRYTGMCNIGTKPTVNAEKIRQIEVHLFDFSGDLYDQTVSIEPIAKIRDEQQFDGIESLIAQLQQDEADCRQLFR